MNTFSRNIGRMLVTGAGGFVGGHVANAVASGSYGAAEYVPPPGGWDIRDEAAVDHLIAEVQPDSVLHLAAQSFVPRSFENPRETFEINVMGTLNLLQALKRQRFNGRLLYVSSGDVYGRVPDEAMPVDEARLPEPRSPYAASKIAAEQCCLAWYRAEGLDAVIARPFNHVGPGQNAKFVLPALARQVIAIAEGRQSPLIEAGDIDVTRDFTDVRDVVNAYASILQKGRSGATYLVSSGNERSVRSILADFCRLAGVEPDVRQDPAKLRSAEQRRMVANAALLRIDTGWVPRISFNTTLQSILDDARI